MKRGYVWVVVLAFLLLASQSFAQYSRRNQIELYGGAAFPMAPDEFKDYYKVGLSVHGQYVMFPSPTFGISFGAAYETFSFDEDQFMDDFGREMGYIFEYYGLAYSEDYLTIEGSASIVELGIGLRPYLSSPENSTQFFLFGMGTYNLLTTETTVGIEIPGYGSSEESDTGEDDYFGVAAGAGFELPFGSSMNLIIQGLYRFIFTEDEATSFIGATAGLVF